MKMMSKTNSTSVNGVMLISAMTSWSCCDESRLTVVPTGSYLPEDFDG